MTAKKASKKTEVDTPEVDQPEPEIEDGGLLLPQCEVDERVPGAEARLMKWVEDTAEEIGAARVLLVGDLAWRIWGKHEFIEAMKARGLVNKMLYIPRSQTTAVEVRLCPSLGAFVVMA